MIIKMSAPIIITVPENYLLEDAETSIGLAAVSPLPPRKRKLDHLSWEEKMQRKKLKNRVAAQTSRDRKKAKMEDMELRISHLEDMNERLSTEMESLKALNERLMGENASLRAARDVLGPQRPAAGGAPGGDPRHTPPLGDVPALSDILAHLDSPEYLDTLNQLAESLLKEIDANSPGAPEDVSGKQPGQCPEGAQVVGSTTEHVEPSRSEIITKADVDRIMAQHSYAHPYPKSKTKDIIKKEEDNDKGDLFYASFDEANDCITVEVPCEDQVVEEVLPITVETDFETLTNGYSEVILEKDMKLLSPMSLSPQLGEENILAVSPAHTFTSDLGYESLASPLSEPESMDLSDFWCDSFAELFPGLA